MTTNHRLTVTFNVNQRVDAVLYDALINMPKGERGARIIALLKQGLSIPEPVPAAAPSSVDQSRIEYLEAQLEQYRVWAAEWFQYVDGRLNQIGTVPPPMVEQIEAVEKISTDQKVKRESRLKKANW